MAIRWEKFTVKSQEAMQQAQARAAELGNPEVQLVHLLLALIEDREGVIPSVLEKIGVPTERLELDLHPFKAYADVELPLYYHFTGDQLAAKTLFRVNVSYMF